MTCYCSRYNFPHRLGGGKCKGREWAEYYFLHDKGECEKCILNHYSNCEVSSGQESIKHCEGFADHLRGQYSERFPKHEP